MNKIIIYFIVSFVSLSCTNRTKTDLEPENEMLEDTISVLINSEDVSKDSLAQYFEKKGSVIKIKDALPNGQGVYTYFQVRNGKAQNLKLYIQYENHNIYRFSLDGEKYTYKTDKSRGSGDNKVSWYDYPVKTMDMKLLRTIAKSNQSRVIFSDGTSTLISRETKEGIRRTLDYFEALGGEFPPYILIK